MGVTEQTSDNRLRKSPELRTAGAREVVTRGIRFVPLFIPLKDPA